MSTVYTRYAQVVHERLRKEIEYCSKTKIGNRSHDCIRGRPFDFEGGGLAIFGNKYSELENAENK